jgi:hypothetical protein
MFLIIPGFLVVNERADNILGEFVLQYFDILALFLLQDFVLGCDDFCFFLFHFFGFFDRRSGGLLLNWNNWIWVYVG